MNRPSENPPPVMGFVMLVLVLVFVATGLLWVAVQVRG